MTQTSTIIEGIIENLDSLRAEYPFRVLKAFEVRALPIPLSENCLSITPNSCKTTFFENENSEYCESNEIEIRLNCFTPTTKPANISHVIAEQVADHISDTYPNSVTGYSIGDAEYDSKIRGYKLTCIINFKFEQCAAEGSISDELTVPKNFFCKTHVLDTNIHITALEREMLNEPFQTGTYTGTGEGSTIDVSVGFPPKFVVVYRTSSYPCVHNSEDGKTICYTAYAFKGNHTPGVILNSLGFYAYNMWNSDGEARLNDEGETYAYIAYK